MLELIKANPYSLLGIMVVADVIGLAVFSAIMLKKENKNSAVKKILVVLAIVLAVDGAYSVYVFRTNTFYDRNCEKYTSMQSVVYYNKSGKAYKLEDKYFKSIDGTDMFLADRAYVDSDGFLVYDRAKKIHKTDLECFYADDDGNKYYKATEVKWNSSGEVGIIIN